MRIAVRLGTRGVVFAEALTARSAERAQRPRSHAEALSLLRGFESDPAAPGVFRRVLRMVDPSIALERLSDRVVRDQLAWQLVSGRVSLLDVVDRRAAAINADEQPSEPAADPGEAPDGSAWIEIALVDERREPVPNEPYRVRLADGKTREGRLDGSGLARLDSIPAGTCMVSFPRRDRGDWFPLEAKPLAWVEIALFDHDGAPMAGAEYVVIAANGTEKRGFLGPRGTARCVGLSDAATCKVVFPQYDSADVRAD